MSNSWGWGTAIWWTTIRWWIEQTITITVKEANADTPVQPGLLRDPAQASGRRGRPQLLHRGGYLTGSGAMPTPRL